MILSRKIWPYKGIPLVERVSIRLPYRYETVFEEEGCFVFVKDLGSTVFSIDGTANVSANEAMLLKCGTYFVDWVKETSLTEVEVIAVHLNSTVVQELYHDGIPDVRGEQSDLQQVKRILPNEVLYKFIESLEFYFDHPELINDEILKLKIKELVLLLIQFGGGISVQQLLSDLLSPVEISLKKIIKAHLYSNLTIEELAKLSGMSLSGFKRKFQTVFGTSPNQYLKEQRIKKACELLRNSSRNITEIAFEVGYNDPSYFTRIFKKVTGTTPMAYKLSLAMS
ncbi:helix-turn-helix domain-containing protein [Fulvivirga ligni]|uniref:helix-turn-helix domain-containing protein n=1 Tax=Fulvivirga ligni TaxID=2904246 RepID=UPI001F417F5A|nr:AraC family transcriptional regulator [Fulvivirga ligni]UII23365.1 AraC family transcriptional regulator [Fulvivirga ligni]